jgi:hypothetical protein
MKYTHQKVCEIGIKKKKEGSLNQMIEYDLIV